MPCWRRFPGRPVVLCDDATGRAAAWRGAGLGVDRGCVFTGPERVAVGDGCSFGLGTMLIAETAQPRGLVLGEAITTSSHVVLNANDGGRIKIGDNTLIGPNVVVRASGHVFAGLCGVRVVPGPRARHYPYRTGCLDRSIGGSPSGCRNWGPSRCRRGSGCRFRGRSGGHSRRRAGPSHWSARVGDVMPRCPACGSQLINGSGDPYPTDSAHAMAPERVVECLSCGLGFADPMPTDQDLSVSTRLESTGIRSRRST